MKTKYEWAFIGFVKHSRLLIKRKKTSIITIFHNYNQVKKPLKRGERIMNKTLIVLGVGIWGVMLLLRFVIPTDPGSNTILLLNIIEIVAFIITVAGIVKRD
jgi:hypothetical protein